MADQKENVKEFDAEAWKKSKADELNEVMGKLEQGVQEVFGSEKYKEYLDVCARLPRYSLNNQLLIAMQTKGQATMVQSFTNWKEMGRYVKKGEKGIKILAPAPYKVEREQDKIGADGKPVLDSDGEHVKETVEVNVTAFKVVNTFDISQTDGKEVPTLGAAELVGTVEGFAAFTEALKSTCPVPITFENIESGAKGYFHTEDNRIAIQEGMSEVQTVKTMIHEMAHQKLHSTVEGERNKQSANSKEVEAESVAYVVCQHYGIDTSDYSFGYVAGWSQGKETPELRESLDTIRKAASEIIASVDEKLENLTKDQMKEQAKVKPFEQGQVIGTVKIKPEEPVNIAGDKPIRVTMEQPEEKKADKKISVKEKLAENKEKAAKTPKSKKTVDKSLGEAI